MGWGCLSRLGFVVLALAGGCEAECASDDGQCGVVLTPRLPEEPILWTDGMDAPVGTGHVFIIDRLAIADRGRGYDLDGRCRSEGDCVDNSFAPIGQLGNDQIRQGLLGGETLLIVEVAGLDVPIERDDDEVTLKLYGARDADDPFFPANNFQVPQGESGCCEFLANGHSLDGNSQPYIRLPARLRRGRLGSRFPVPAGLAITAGDLDPNVDGLIPMERVQFSARLGPHPEPSGHRRPPFLAIDDILFGFGVPARGLAKLQNPYCKTRNQLCPRQLVDSTLLDLMLNFWQPDVDLDDEAGLERFELGPSGRVEHCVDEAGVEVIGVDPERPWSCAFEPQMGDGFSVAFDASGIEAEILGISHD